MSQVIKEYDYNGLTILKRSTHHSPLYSKFRLNSGEFNPFQFQDEENGLYNMLVFLDIKALMLGCFIRNYF